jgi:hypothetical protein
MIIVVSAKNSTLAGLKWVSGRDLRVSYTIRKSVGHLLWQRFASLRHHFTAELLGQLEDFDFRYMLVSETDGGSFSSFAEWLFSWVSSG